MKFYEDKQRILYNGDCQHMVELDSESVQCAVTSPPYWGLRKYEGNQDLIWGGDLNCEHQWDIGKISLLHENRNFHKGTQEEVLGSGYKLAHTHKTSTLQAGFCSLCGAWKGAFGAEPMPELYVQHTVEILREVRRVLRKDGVVFWNIGDSYASGKGSCFNPGGGASSLGKVRKGAGAHPLNRGNISDLHSSGLKPKDLCLIPQRVMIAAQEDGWWVRSVIIWNKTNPMPESVRDRPTNSYEFILMLTKSGSSLFWTHRDKDGTRTRPGPDYRWLKQVSNIRGLKTKGIQEVNNLEQNHGLDIAPQDIVEEVAIKPEGWTRKNKMGWDRINLWEGHDYYWDADAVRELYTGPLNRWGGDTLKRETKKTLAYKDEILGASPSSALRAGNPIRPDPSGRNLRDVWNFPTTPFPGAHFAVFPEKLPELCIKAATSEKGCCPKCGAPWARVVKKHGSGPARKERKNTAIRLTRIAGQEWQDWKGEHPNETLGWKPTCECGCSETIPCTVLDPFAGSGSTLLVATKLGRKSVGYEISESYCKMTVNRNRQGAL